MSRITVVTGFSPSGYDLYGRQFIETFNRYAPYDLDLVVYSAEPVPMPRGRCVPHAEVNGAVEFHERNKNIPERCGKAPVPGWRKKDERAGYSYRHDAVRFAWQLLYPDHAADSVQHNDILAWFDGDVVFNSPIDTGWIERTLSPADLSFLGRETHTELGFWAVRMTHPGRAFVRALAETYRTDAVFKLPEWHSAYVFDHCRKGFIGTANDLTPGQKGDVWRYTRLIDFSKHLKGNLKNSRTAH